VSTIDDLRSHLAQAIQDADELAAILEGEGIEWLPMSETPDGYGYYKVLANVFGETMVVYSCWTGFQWANVFPVQERLGWAEF